MKSITALSALNALSDFLAERKIYFQIVWIWAFLTSAMAALVVLVVAFVFWTPPDFRFWEWAPIFRCALLLDAVASAALIVLTLRRN